MNYNFCIILNNQFINLKISLTDKIPKNINRLFQFSMFFFKKYYSKVAYFRALFFAELFLQGDSLLRDLSKST